MGSIWRIRLLTLQNDKSKGAFRIWQVEPKIIRAFITSEGIKAKTDKIDARLIALFASKKTPTYCSIDRSDNKEQLKALSRRRADLLQMITMETNRVKHPQQQLSTKAINKHIKYMEKEIGKIDEQVGQLIANDPTMNAKAQILKSIPGVGNVTVSALLAYMPELGKIGDNKISSLLGVAPFDNQIGNFKGKSTIAGGRRHARKVVYMAAISAVRCNPTLKSFYKRLRENGKGAKVAIIAVMRKLITTINVTLRKEEHWRVV